MDVETFLEDIRQAKAYRDQIVHVHRVPTRAARYAAPQAPLSPSCARMLESMGICQLYMHQARSLDAVRVGSDVLVATGTASGKTLCYQLPIFEALEADPQAKVMALYPTKALSQDQLRVFQRGLQAASLESVFAGVMDGDTPSNQRRRIRDAANIIITNPDMVHAAILPRHGRWAQVFAHLKYIVVDELHTYVGLFGSSAANLFRRLHRVCEHYGSRPQFIASSATIGNPLELAGQVIGRDFELIDEDGSPHGARTYVFWNPPQVRARRRRSRRSANVEAHELMVELMKAGAPTITFSKAKVTSELIYRYVRETLEKSAPELASKVTPYRGGYLPEERREIEQRLFSGELLGVSSTRALELGIDVGALEACIVVGYPGTLSAFFQQGGRAGRRDREALVMLVGVDTTINQYVMKHPEYIFGRPTEEGVVVPDNPYVLIGQLRCACHELPLQQSEVPQFGHYAPLVLDVLQSQHKVALHKEAWYHASAEVPQHEVSLRDYADKNVAIIDVSNQDRVIGQMNKFDAQPILHKGAIYLHQGDTYLVEELDLERYQCRVRKVDVDYYTQPLGGTDVHHIDHQLRDKPFGIGQAFFGEVTAYFRNHAYERISFYTLDALSVHDLDLPHFTLETMAFWLVPPEPVCQQALEDGLDAHSGLRGIGYATRMVLPLFVRCETLDFSHTIGAANAPWHTVFVYERYPLGLGFTERAYERLGDLMPAVYEHVRACECVDGCPCCVGKPLRQYTTWNIERGEAHIPSKTATLRILEGFLDDRSNLHQPDAASLGQDTEEARLALERGLRRRLERMREPEFFHPIEQGITTEYPKPEPRATLDSADVARRALRRRKLGKLMRGVPTNETGEPLKPLPPRTAEKTHAQTEPETPTRGLPKQTRVMGDSVAGRARKLKKRKGNEPNGR